MFLKDHQDRQASKQRRGEVLSITTSEQQLSNSQSSSSNNMSSPAKLKCVPLKPPLPSKFQGDLDKVIFSPVPEFSSLANFPIHENSVDLPDGMRCCVMCGQACFCGKGKKKVGASGGSASSATAGLSPRSGNTTQEYDNKSNAIIPTQNKGLCTLCDVNVWVVVTSGLEIKWCKGCKNFRPWAAFGEKGLATKCLRCRERQKEKYRLQKEEKEYSRVVKETGLNK